MASGNITKQNFARSLESLRLARGWTQRQLADASGLTQSAVSNYLKGTRSPGADELHALSTVLGVTMDFLWTGKPPSPAALDAAKHDEAIRQEERDRLVGKLEALVTDLTGDELRQHARKQARKRLDGGDAEQKSA